MAKIKQTLKQFSLHVVLVALALAIGAGTMAVVKADNIDTESCGGVFNEYYIDADGDTYGDSSASSTLACVLPAGYSVNNLDCDDANNIINPLASETCDAIDNNCDGSINENIATSTYYRDIDTDSYGDASTTLIWCALPVGYAANQDDCNDLNSVINPAAFEACDGLDNNCNLEVDEGCTASSTWYRDADSDGYGNSQVATTSVGQPSGYVLNSQDCNDSSNGVHPGAVEVCDNIDNDCDGTVDEGVKQRFYFDGDDDNYGLNSMATSSCAAPTDYVSDNTDCNDSSSAINPGAAEVCDNIDNDCDGIIDEGCSTTSTWYRDADGDSYGDPSKATTTETQPSGYVSNSQDCNDANAAIKPGATEVCDFVDNNCDARIDEGLRKRFYFDNDDDGYGNSNVATSSCSAPADYVANKTDCNDDNSNIHPGTAEVCDDIDNNCDGNIDENLNCDDSNTCGDCNCKCKCTVTVTCDCDGDGNSDQDRDRDRDRNNDDWDDNDDDNNYSSCDGPFKNHGQYVSCWAHLTNSLKWQGKIDINIKGKIMSEVAKNKNKKDKENKGKGKNK